MEYIIVSDSSADLLSLNNTAFCSVPLKIITDEKEYVDDATLNVLEMTRDLLAYKGTSRSSCPNVSEWKEAFGDYDRVICVTMTSNLSGSYNAARLAMQEYLEENPEKKGLVLDTLSTGPENELVILKLEELIQKGLEIEEIETEIKEYMKKTHLIFCLDSLKNLANNGRVSGAVAKIAGILGIRIIGKASNIGTLEITNKARGPKRALEDILKNMLSNGYIGGKLSIHHCNNVEAAQELKQMVQKKFPVAPIILSKTRGLCSFYAEAGGVLVGYEGYINSEKEIK